MKKAEIRQFWWKKRRKWPKNEHFGASPKGPPEFPAHRVRFQPLEPHFSLLSCGSNQEGLCYCIYDVIVNFGAIFT